MISKKKKKKNYTFCVYESFY